MTTNTNGRWTLTIETPLSGKVNVRFASETAARAYRDSLLEKNEETGLNDVIDEFEGERPTYTVWFDPAANPSVNIPSLNNRPSFCDALDSPDAYDPNDY